GFHRDLRLRRRREGAAVAQQPVAPVRYGEWEQGDGIDKPLKNADRDGAVGGTGAARQRRVDAAEDGDGGEHVGCVAGKPGSHEGPAGVALRMDVASVDTPGIGDISDDVTQ